VDQECFGHREGKADPLWQRRPDQLALLVRKAGHLVQRGPAYVSLPWAARKAKLQAALAAFIKPNCPCPTSATPDGTR